MSSTLCTFLFAGMLLTFSGCATPNSLLEKTPMIEYISPQSPKTITSIISLEWSKHNATVNTMISGDGFIISIVAPADGSAQATASILPSGTGSIVRYAEAWHAGSPNWFSEAVLLCKPTQPVAP
jgi:hypothetical protein